MGATIAVAKFTEKSLSLMSEIVDLDQVVAARDGGGAPDTEPAPAPATEPEPATGPVATGQPDPTARKTPEKWGAAAGAQPDGAEKPEPAVDFTKLFVGEGDKKRSVAEMLEQHEAQRAQLEALDKDVFLSEFLKVYRGGGDVLQFLEVKKTDWDKVSDLDVLRRRLDEQNAGLSERARNKIFESEILNKYKIGDASVKEGSDEYQINMELLKRDADKVRSEKKDVQRKYSVPDPAERVGKSNDEMSPEELSRWRQSVVADDTVSKFLKEKKIPVSAGKDGLFALEVDKPEDAVEMIVDERRFWDLFFKDTKQKKGVDFGKASKVFAFAADPAAYEERLIDIGRALGEEAYVKERKNAGGAMNERAGFGEGGLGVTESEFKSGFLKEALKQKRR